MALSGMNRSPMTNTNREAIAVLHEAVSFDLARYL